MKNEYKILGDTTIIYLNRKDGTILEALIDTTDLPRAKEFPNTWYGTWNESTESFYVTGHVLNEEGKRKAQLLHRFILNTPKGKVVDHIFHNTLDNRRENLRVLTHEENHQNRKGATRKSKSGIRGVHWHKASNKWVARIKIKGKHMEIGSFIDIKEAEKAVIEARKQIMPYSTN